jgi:putative restriction endonuclease
MFYTFGLNKCMKQGQRLWTKEELILAINLYSKMPFGQMHQSNSAIIDLAGLIGRTPASVAYKLVNFASLDPQLRKRGIKGMGNASKLDNEVWRDYMNNWDDQFIEGEKLLARRKHTTLEKLYNIDLETYEEVEGTEKVRTVSTRVNQHIFRSVVLSNFNNQCCITGINFSQLLVASHITKRSQDKGNRLKPTNGLALNALHDKAFESGLITITEDLKIKVSPILLKQVEVQSIKQNFVDYDGRQLIEPKKFYPDPEFIKIHNSRFKA